MKIQVKLTRHENADYFGKLVGSIVTMDMETYLLGVVPAEIGIAPQDACQAQTVAARTYALPYVMKGDAISDASSVAQAYRASRANNPAYTNAHEAVRQTAGEVLHYGGKVLATCSYSASNGGRTTSSVARWGGYRPYLIEQDDPWDFAATGGKKTGHGVGMSQAGASFAAGTLGIGYRKILGFYYPGTELQVEYGSAEVEETEGETIMDKTNVGLVNWAKQYLGEAYWYRTCAYSCTSSQLASKAAQYPSHYKSESRMPRYRQDIAGGKRCCDCVGLLKGYLWETDGKIVYNKDTDVNTGGLYSRCSVKGAIHTLPEVPGLILYTDGHVGVYIGNGECIEARGFAYGIVKTKVAERTWTHWLACPWISYAGYEDKLVPGAFEGPYTALVNTKSSPLNIWSSPAKTLSLLRVNKGDTVRVIGYGGQLGWMRVEKNGVQGVADAQYLLRVEEAGIGDVPDDGGDSDAPGGEHKAEDVLYRARVVNVKTGLNLRTTPGKTDGNTILLMPLDVVVEVLDDTRYGSFAYICYGGVYGYCTRSYLYQLEDTPESLYNVVLQGVTADVVDKVLALYPAAVVTEVL